MYKIEPNSQFDGSFIRSVEADQNQLQVKLEPKQSNTHLSFGVSAVQRDSNEKAAEQKSFQIPIKLDFGPSISGLSPFSPAAPKVESLEFVKPEPAQFAPAVTSITAPKVESAENSHFRNIEHNDTSDTLSEAAPLCETKSDLTVDDDDEIIIEEEPSNSIMSNLVLSVYMSNLRNLAKEKSLASANSKKKSKSRNSKKNLAHNAKKRKRTTDSELLALISPGPKRISLKTENKIETRTFNSTISQLEASLETAPSTSISEIVSHVPEPTFSAMETAQSEACPVDCGVAL
eukprot:TRINITY_DN14605_c0_g1_i1.p1 TRINITY_DN14605_c0_g1~~TRINITY_DN14605_c0_g1_i1.p1  ORF type:complete len:290 (+),score=63.83 TRINITY_DN14605_c0_g1_i1:42-911(+)